MAQWKPVEGYPGLGISDGLDFRSSVTSNPLKVNLSKGHYPSVWVNSRKASVNVHVLVCTAFHGSGQGRMALHRDGNIYNWHPDNLYWGDHKKNASDAAEHGTLAKGEVHGLSKLTEEAVSDIRANLVLRDPEFSAASFAKKYGVTPHAVRHVFHGRTWTHVEGI